MKRQNSKSSGVLERRRSPRIDWLGDAWLSSPAGKREERIEVSTVDLSLHGLAFEHDTALTLSAHYVIEFERDGKIERREFRVVRCAKAASGNYRIGADFV